MLQENRCHSGHNWVVCLENFPLLARQEAGIYDAMASSLNGDVNSLKEENKNSKMYKDLIKTIRGAFENDITCQKK